MTFKQLVGQIQYYKDVLVSLGGELEVAKGIHNEMIGGELSWADFLAQPEIGLTVREANNLIKLSEWVLGEELPIWDINLATARFCASRGILDPSLVGDMKVLSLKDFKDRHYDAVQEKDNAPRTYKYMVMRRCNETGTLSKVYGEEVEKIEEDIKNIIKDE